MGTVVYIIGNWGPTCSQCSKMGVPGNPMYEFEGGFQARENGKIAVWGSQVQLGSVRGSLITLKSFFRTIFGQLILLNSPLSPPLSA